MERLTGPGIASVATAAEANAPWDGETILRWVNPAGWLADLGRPRAYECRRPRALRQMAWKVGRKARRTRKPE
jgi:hypothetical protein